MGDETLNVRISLSIRKGGDSDIGWRGKFGVFQNLHFYII